MRETIEEIVSSLEDEMDGFIKSAKELPSEDRIHAYYKQLKNAIKERNYPKVQSNLNRCDEWFKQKISRIHSAGHALYTYDDLCRDMEVISDFCKRINKFKLMKCEDKGANSKKQEPLVFISHSSKDEIIAKAVCDFLMGIGISREDIFCSSHPLNKIPIQESSYEYIRSKINQNTLMLFLWSDNFIESIACFIEIGAWLMVQCEYWHLYTLAFDLNNPIYRNLPTDAHKQGVVLDGTEMCRTGMIELAESIRGHLKIPQPSNVVIDRYLNNFIETIAKKRDEQ